MKYVNMTEALRQVREKAPNTADAMARHKAGNAGFTDKAHLKAKGLIPRADGTKKVSEQIEVRFQLPKNNHRRNTFKTQSDADKYADAIKKKGGVVDKVQPSSMSKNIDDVDQQIKLLNLGEVKNEELEEKFTKKDFDKNEDENDHSLNAIMLAKEFGTSQEIKDMEAIDKRHKQRGHIEDPDYSKRNALVRKYHPRLK